MKKEIIDTKHPAQNEHFGVYGISKREECVTNLSEVGEYEICVSKSRILV